MLDANIIKAITADGLKGKTAPVNAKDVLKAKTLLSTTLFGFIDESIIICGQIGSDADSIANKLIRKSNYFMVASRQETVQRAIEMRTILFDNKKELINITTANLVIIDKVIADYDLIKDQPSLNIHKRKDYSTLVAQKAIKDGRKNVTNLVLLVKKDCGISDPTLVAAFEHAEVVVILGKRYTPVNITLLDDLTGKVILNGSATELMRKNIKYYKLSKTGILSVATHTAGEAEITVKATGFADQLINPVIKKWETNEIVVRMKVV